jgi:hypothetical protein
MSSLSSASNEAACRFVSSRGLLKSCSIHSSYPRSSSPNDLEHVRQFIVNQDKYRHRQTPVGIYVCCDAFQEFIQTYANQITVPYIVVSGDGDLTMFHEAVPREKYHKFLMFMISSNLRGLFSQNMDIQACRVFLTEKITKLWTANAAIYKTSDAPKTLEDAIHQATQKLRQFPIGMDYHTISANPWHRWASGSRSTGRGASAGTDEHADHTPLGQERTLIREIRDNMKPFHQRKIRIFSNVMLCPDRFNDRVSAIREIPAGLITQQTTFLPRTQTWKTMTEFAFVLSPFGNGMDCHRTWEALLCGCIPIVRSTVFNELFEGLPVLIVEKWSDISLQLLVTTLADFKNKHDKKELKYEKLELAYYTKMFS